MECFRSGEILVLCATEVVGMVCTLCSNIDNLTCTLQGTDIRDIDDVVQIYDARGTICLDPACWTRRTRQLAVASHLPC
jgi:hypothetical protein